MIRVFTHFGVSCPCSAPLNVVAQRQAHANTVLRGIIRTVCRQENDPRISAAQLAAALDMEPLFRKISISLDNALLYPNRHQVPEELRSTAEEKAKTATPRLQAVWPDFKLFQDLAFELEPLCC